MAFRKEENYNFEGTDFDLDEITEKVLKLFIQKVTTSDKIDEGKSKLLFAIQNLKRVFNEVLCEEEMNAVADIHCSEVSGSDSRGINFTELDKCSLSKTPAAVNNARIVNETLTENSDYTMVAGDTDDRNTPHAKKLFPGCNHKYKMGSNGLPSNEDVTANVANNDKMVERSDCESPVRKNQENLTQKYNLRSTPSRSTRLDTTMQSTMDIRSCNKTDKDYFDMKSAVDLENFGKIVENGFESPIRENQENSKDPYNLRNTPSRINRLENDAIPTEDVNNSGKIAENEFESPVRENQENFREPYNLRNTPARINCLEDDTSPFVDVNNSGKIAENEFESPVRENQENFRDPYNLRSTPPRMTRLENDAIPTVDFNKSGKIAENEFEPPVRESQENLRDPYNLRSTPSRMTCLENDAIPTVDVNNSGKIAESEFESPVRENQENFRDSYNLRNTPSRINRLEDDMTTTANMKISGETFDNGGESPTEENQGIFGYQYNWRNITYGNNRLDDDENSTTDMENTEEIVDKIIYNELRNSCNSRDTPHKNFQLGCDKKSTPCMEKSEDKSIRELGCESPTIEETGNYRDSLSLKDATRRSGQRKTSMSRANNSHQFDKKSVETTISCESPAREIHEISVDAQNMKSQEKQNCYQTFSTKPDVSANTSEESPLRATTYSAKSFLNTISPLQDLYLKSGDPKSRLCISPNMRKFAISNVKNRRVTPKPSWLCSPQAVRSDTSTNRTPPRKSIHISGSAESNKSHKIQTSTQRENKFFSSGKNRPAFANVVNQPDAGAPRVPLGEKSLNNVSANQTQLQEDKKMQKKFSTWKFKENKTVQNF